ncbi:glycosyltransferase family 25 protein, partial [Salmonella enterica]|uniref:glycosyltransferase family 25 protein n=2 Tax=Pseudomonadota TaxID=1224 RepID=UPI003CECCF7B
PAVDGRLLSEEELSVRYDRARAIEESHDLTRGEIGCALSHHGVYCEMVRQGITHALVLEDDARLNDQVPGLLP